MRTASSPRPRRGSLPRPRLAAPALGALGSRHAAGALIALRRLADPAASTGVRWPTDQRRRAAGVAGGRGGGGAATAGTGDRCGPRSAERFRVRGDQARRTDRLRGDPRPALRLDDEARSWRVIVDACRRSLRRAPRSRSLPPTGVVRVDAAPAAWHDIDRDKLAGFAPSPQRSAPGTSAHQDQPCRARRWRRKHRRDFAYPSAARCRRPLRNDGDEASLLASSPLRISRGLALASYAHFSVEWAGALDQRACRAGYNRAGI